MYQKIIFIILFLFSCNQELVESKGDFNEIVIISSLEDKDLLEPIIDEYIFNEKIYTPEPELVYKKIWITPDGFRHYKNYSNIIIVSISYPIDNSIDKLISEFKNKNNIDNFPIILNDVYAKPQIITLINESNNKSLKSNLNSTIELIDENINNHIDTLLIKRYKQRIDNIDFNNEITKLADSLFSIDILLDSNFKIIDYDIKDKMFWIGKGTISYNMNATYQWLIYKKINYKEIDGNINFLKVVNSEMRKVDQNIQLINNFNKFSFIDNSNINIYKLYSLYNHNLYKTGGPLVVYLINNKISKESVLVYGLVNAPGVSKNMLIKELETIILNSNF